MSRLSAWVANSGLVHCNRLECDCHSVSGLSDMENRQEKT